MAARSSGRVIDGANGRLKPGQLAHCLALENDLHQLLVGKLTHFQVCGNRGLQWPTPSPIQ